MTNLLDKFQLFTLLAVILFAVIGIPIYVIIKNWRHIRVIKETPTSKLANAQGYVELAGKQYSWNKNPIRAPLQGIKCSWFQYEVEVPKFISINGKSRLSWQIIAKGSSEAPILLVDGSGHCLIDPDGADILVTNKKKWAGTSENPQDGKQMTFALGTAQVALGSFRYRYQESVMHSGSHIHAIGQVEKVSINDQLVQDWLNQYPELSHVLKEDTIKIMSKKGIATGKPFIIADKKERALLQAKNIDILGYAVALIFALAIIYLWLRVLYFDAPLF